jgi:2-polyprenyl-3-methyl-5-hydroxy-6-metoxy-1,4-benzoquinol methylase
VGIIGGRLGEQLLAWLCPTGDTGYLTGEAYANRSKLQVLFGDRIYDEIRDRVVIDFGCGPGAEAVEMALRGARRVVGIDLREEHLESGRRRAAAAGIADRCDFRRSPDEPADVVVSLDSFEHFENPAHILRVIDAYLKPEGKVLVTFGPTWYHPLGGHVFSVFPWAHLLFTERALLRWRKSFHPEQTARTVEECGLNKITIRRFRRIVADSCFEFEWFAAPPIRGIRWLSLPLIREFGTATVRCGLVRKGRETKKAAVGVVPPRPTSDAAPHAVSGA